LYTPSHFASITYAILSIGGWISVAWLAADEHAFHTPPSPPSAVPADPPRTVPSTPSPATDTSTNDASNDPLYQAIREQLKDGRPSLIPNGHQNIVPTHVAGKKSVTDAEWRAAELMLRAARILARKERNADAINQPTDHTATVKQLRASALEILRKELSE
jgi:hypothetical protein